jgi:hypothetical protein
MAAMPIICPESLVNGTMMNSTEINAPSRAKYYRHRSARESDFDGAPLAQWPWQERLRRHRWCRPSRSGDRCSATVSSASSAGFSARCSAGISASLTGSNPRGIASGGSCQLITQSPRRPIRNGVRRWQSGSVLVAYPRKPSRRRPHRQWSLRSRSGVAANRDRQPRIPRALDDARQRSQMKIVVNQAGGWLIA